jgi:broad specificity phosphatase PhoE
MRLLLAPHAPTDWNMQSRLQGHSDTALSDHGRHQAAQLASRLMCEPIAEVYSSDLRRAMETAVLAADPRGLTVRSDPRLRELHFGNWEGLTYDEVGQADPLSLAAWEADVLLTAPPGGETLAHMADRLSAFYADLNAEAAHDKTVLVVAHRGSLQVLLCLAIGLLPEWRWKLRLEPASLTELHLYPTGPVLICLNDVHHLREGGHAS